MFGLKKLIYGNKHGIPKNVVERLKTPPQFTPDTAELQSRKHNLVLLYGNEINGGRDTNHEVKPLYSDVFTADPFIMIKTTKGEKVAPAVINPPDRVIGSVMARLPKAPVKGSLYQLTDREIEDLDKHYENGVVFDRVRVKVRVEHYAISNHLHEQRISEALFYEKKAFMYIGRYEVFSFAKISRQSINLYKERPDNLSYEPRYYYSPQDW